MKLASLLALPVILVLLTVALVPASEAVSPNVPQFANAHVVTTSSSTSENAPDKNERAEGKPDPRPKRP